VAILYEVSTLGPVYTRYPSIPNTEMGGTHLGGGFVLGWVAGRAAATGVLEKSHHAKGTFGQQFAKNKNVDLSVPIISVEGW
jgi:hypothetical protein